MDAQRQPIEDADQENSMEQLISYLPKYSIAMTRKVKL